MTTTNSQSQSHMLLTAVMAFCIIFFVSNKAYANDFLQKQSHYMAYATGADRVHFKLPVYSRGARDFYLESTRTYASYSVVGGSTFQIFYFGGEINKDGPSAKDTYSYGRAWVEALPNRGVVQIVNTTSGQVERVPTDGHEHVYNVRKEREADNDNDYVTWLEIDWYPPESLSGKTFSVSIHVDDYLRMTGNSNYVYDWTLCTGLVGQESQTPPELYDPYFYGVVDQGIAGYGYAAIPYMVYNEPISYYTSLNANEVKTSDRSGNIYVPTTDTVQEQFFATFTTWYDKPNKVPAEPIQSTKVNIRPYHRLYDLTVTEEKDSTNTFTGNNVLHWRVRNPELVDLVENDYFEIQRALQSDFSDAKTLEVKPMERGLEKAIYTYVDDSREIWTGNAAAAQDSKEITHLSATAKDYILRDANGNPLYSMEITATAKSTPLPAVPVYYRVRRASSAVWGWTGHEFVLDTVCEKHSYLAPLATTQPNYRKDADYATNRKVHFTIDIENRAIDNILTSDFEMTYTYKKCLMDSVPIMIYRNGSSTGHDGEVWVHNKDGVFVRSWSIGNDTLRMNVETGSRVSFFQVSQWYGSTSSSLSEKYEVTAPAVFAVSVTEVLNVNFNWYSVDADYKHSIECREGPEMIIGDAFDRVRTHLTDTMQTLIQKEAQKATYGKAMWDRTAQLILVKTMDGIEHEIIIPQDSIRHLPNGNWQAHYADLANNACTNYSYAVRIDQNTADLCVYDSAMLLPVAIHGESLYFDEGATIVEFTASEDDARGDHKRSIVLNWQPSSMAVDRYVLTRIVDNSDAAADTIYQGQEPSYFDLSAVPGVTYRYTITALYDCNGRHSDHSASAVGRRTIYGEIRGNVLMPDNSGMAGVSVALQGPDGQLLRTAVTDADGAYSFDSLTYDIATGSSFVVIPTHAYGVFSFNNTSAATASITLSADNAIAYGIGFVNTSTARLSGRALYKGSTIPVAGAMFLLNGDTVRSNSAPLRTAIDGTFELTVTKSQLNTLQIFKPGHTFEGEGILRVEDGSETFSLDKSLDGVRFYDETKVRLIGRVAGGVDQRDLQRGFGIGTNNLGDDLQLVLQLEGDNTAHFVHDPNDLTRDTMQQTVNYAKILPEGGENVTHTLFEKKRITIRPDQTTGEYAVDLYPVKYKVVQATAKGYSTLFASGTGSETFDLTNAPLTQQTDTYRNNTIQFNAVYDRIYRTPVEVELTQLLYGIEQDGFGEPMMKAAGFTQKANDTVYLYTKLQDGTVQYTLGYPVFHNKRQYQFQAYAYEDYYYNNTASGKRDRVPQRGGKVTIRNGMHNSTNHTAYDLDNDGRNRGIWLMVDKLQTEIAGEGALCTVSAALTVEGNAVETDVFRAYVTGDVVLEKDLHAVDAAINLLDIIRDPGGNGSSAWVESGSSYNYSYTESYDWEAGLTLHPQWGLSVSSDIGFVQAANGIGGYHGSTFTTSKTIAIDVPITHEWSWGYKYSYSYTTSEKISTSTKKAANGIGANADVFLGTTVSQLCGKAKSVDVINDSLFQARQPAIRSGAMKVLASGTDAAGKAFHLVVGEKVVLGSTIRNQFAYSQHYILNELLPNIVMEQASLLMDFPDSAAAQAAADALGEPVYWYIDSTQINLRQSVGDYYQMFVPSNSTDAYPDKIAALNHMFANWLQILVTNEKEKIAARMTGRSVGTYSVSYGNTLTHTDSYSAMANYNQLPQGAGSAMDAASMATNIGKNLLSNGSQFAKFFDSRNAARFGETMKKVLEGLTNEQKTQEQGSILQLGTVTNKSKFTMMVSPVLSFDAGMRNSDDKTVKKSCGFTIAPDDQGDITVSVYRAYMDSIWNDTTSIVRSHVTNVPTDQLYGSYVFFTEAGTTFCTHEKEEKTQFYSPGMVLGNATLAMSVPEMSADTYEQTGVPAEQRAVFRIELRNAGQVQTGAAAGGRLFTLELSNQSNPDGAKLYVNGAPLAQGIEYFMEPGESVVQTLEVERGLVDDYENLKLMFKVSECPKNLSFMDLSVHFIPLSCDVNIASPKQNWVMNTLSAKDSTGYYLPIDINGFNIRHKNFDHIEFQYKLSTESEDMWVTQCSFYADDSLYNRATGNKAKIVNGRIEPFRFYGERDPMEQQYDLRAVSFCRYGSGFVSKASTVISGTKDTRVPRVFGAAQPADAILGVGNYLKLRFNEAIAGNYLDEDNNFQITGMTNATGITTGTSLHFNEEESSNAYTQVSRSLTNTSFSLDMIVRPSEAKGGSLFKTLSQDELYAVSLSYSADGMLVLMLSSAEQIAIYPTAAGVLPAGVFSRVVAAYDNEQKTVRFYIGSQLMAVSAYNDANMADFVLRGTGPLRFGIDGACDMLEARVWLKALTPEEVAATNMTYLTGYERDLLAYYRMNEGQGNTVKDYANGATLYLNNTTWNLKKGISLAIQAGERVRLNGNLLSRSAIQDETIMMWFKSTTPDSTLFSAGEQRWTVPAGYADGAWHHWVLTVNRTMNNVSLFIDGEMRQSQSATDFGAISGAMYLGGDGFEGNIDELVFFEQALPKALVQEYGNCSPTGDEMGLFGYLPFEEQVLNPNGVLELVFSGNDQRVFRDPYGNVVDKVIPLVVESQKSKVESMADKINHAPTRDRGLLTKMNFDWAFNNDELLINLNMADREINKQTIYITVRDVEDLSGNPMASPVSWVAFVDRNALKWSQRTLRVESDYDNPEGFYSYIDIINHSGRRHQFTIESLPDWLTVSEPYGSMNAQEEKQIRLNFDANLPVGVYNDQIYLTDEDGLAEPLIIEYTVRANPPYDAIDKNKYPLNMSVCGHVMIMKSGEYAYDTDERDIVYAMYKDECVGMANISFDEASNKSKLYLVVYGTDAMNRKAIRFQLWQASTGKVYDLSASRTIQFAHGNVYGCGDGNPVVLTTNGSERQTVNLNPGWNWSSFNLNLSPFTSKLSTCLTANEPWSDGDQIKNPATRQFVSYSDSLKRFTGGFDYLSSRYTYMIYSKNGNTIHVSGNKLPADSMYVPVRGSGQWNAMPCLLSEVTPVAEALADYYDQATPGDMIKSHDQFAYFSEDKKWEGGLTAMRPGEGYLFRRMAKGDVTIRFYNSKKTAGAQRQKTADAPKRIVESQKSKVESLFSNPQAATNMTMIAQLVESRKSKVESIKVYVGDELAAVAEPLMIDDEPYYFLTIQSDRVGELRFEMNGETLMPVDISTNRQIDISNVADSHHGSLRAPVILRPSDNRPYKIIEDDRVVIIRNGERYDVTGKKLY